MKPLRYVFAWFMLDSSDARFQYYYIMVGSLLFEAVLIYLITHSFYVHLERSVVLPQFLSVVGLLTASFISGFLRSKKSEIFSAAALMVIFIILKIGWLDLIVREILMVIYFMVAVTIATNIFKFEIIRSGINLNLEISNGTNR
jgi:hypothetical protein